MHPSDLVVEALIIWPDAKPSVEEFQIFDIRWDSLDKECDHIFVEINGDIYPAKYSSLKVIIPPDFIDPYYSPLVIDTEKFKEQNTQNPSPQLLKKWNDFYFEIKTKIKGL